MKKLAVLLAAMPLFAVLSFSAEKEMATTVQGFVTDIACAAHGKKTCSDKNHVMKDNPMVLVSDSDTTVFALNHPGKLGSNLGQPVEIKGVVNREQKTIEVKNFEVLN